MPTFEEDIVCPFCDGTGLYIGIGERNGAAVVCHTCEGTGKEHYVFKYKKFERRANPPRKVKRVFQTNPGIRIRENASEGITLKNFGGMPIKEWEAGLSFTPGMEDREHTCPAWFYQSVDYKKKPEWHKCCGVGSFRDCSMFPNKEKCWEKWDKEFGGKK